MSKSANPEQRLAIEHTGGVLLRAGAGSGKTFVLVEHILYLTTSWISEFKVRPASSFEEFIRQKFSQVVMMTFTKKAAGEMSIRLSEKFEERSLTVHEDQKYWIISNELLPILTVTTIDGFCRKLITLGYFPHLSTEAKIIFDLERTDQVRKLVEEWFKLSSDKVNQDVLDIVIREKKALLSSFTHIFSDPGLRLSWKKFNFKGVSPDSLQELLTQSFTLNKLDDSLLAVQSLEIDSPQERSAFEKVVATFQETGLPVVDSVEKFNIYKNLFSLIKKLDGERTAKKKSPASEAAKEGLSQLRDWVNTWRDVLDDYLEHYESKFLPWMNLCLDIFRFIDSRLDPNQGMTFGDIEYHVFLGLENAPDRERIQKTFHYFIVDEFQDTSYVQFQIIRSLIGSNFKNLFCVGDAKQAIYGFRGGELSVFQDCAELVPQVRSLANNYRSLPEIINFNNSLFRTLLPLGQNFEGHDPFSVNAEDQNIPDETSKDEIGKIEIYSPALKRDLEEKGKFQNDDINHLEAIVLTQAIKKERETTQNVCTILYSKLRPSRELIRELMKNEIGFTAQFKIDLVDDPLLGIFISLLKRKFDNNPTTKNHFPIFLISHYLKILGIEEELSVSLLDQFDFDSHYWGIVEAFKKFIFKLNISNENSDINLETIETFAELYHQDPESIMTQLLRGNNDRLSLDLRSGHNSHMVQIMSAHSSKGLEFDSVYLAGIYTNGREQNDGGLFGDLPGSLHWYLDISKREKQKSPLYLFESELAKYKNFSEAKRLFYVACTRAKKKLIWVDFEIPEKSFSIPKNSWILGLRAWLNHTNDIQKVDIIPLPQFDSEKELLNEGIPELPLFFHDPVGIFSKGEGKTELMLSAELSVTRLNALIDCPRKFYYSNILKLTDEKINSVERIEEEEEEVANLVTSSSERGTYIHAQISKGIERNFVVPRESHGTENEAPIHWALNELKTKTDDYHLVSEKQIKFPFFDFMISGIPDLLLLPKDNQIAQVWDFKTGRITVEGLKHYWLQLSIYAYALYELRVIPRDRDIELVLCFVDQKKIIKETVNFENCRKDLYPIWRSQNEPWKVNLDHCSQCSYGSICPR